MEPKRGVKLGDIRGRYDSKYKTDEERNEARKIRQKEYYLRKKAEKKAIEGDTMDFSEIIATKEEIIKSLNAKILLQEKEILRLKQKNDSLRVENSKNIGSKPRRNIVSVEEISCSEEDIKPIKVGNRIITEEQIASYAKIRHKIKNYKDYDMNIEQILSDRSRLPV